MSPPPGSGRRGRFVTPRRYPRTARINEALREVLAGAIARIAVTDERLHMATVTAVQCDPDLRSALVLLSSLDDDGAAALGDARVRLQAVVARQVKMKWTPQLRFEADPAVASGQRIEEILRDLAGRPSPDAPSSPEASPSPSPDAPSSPGDGPTGQDVAPPPAQGPGAG